MKLKTIMIESDSDLYCKYQGQTSEQPVRLCLDLETGELSCYYWVNIGSGQTMRAFHGRDIEWSISPLRKHAVASLYSEIASHAQTILDGATVEWDGSNSVGRLTDEARDAADEIQALIDDTQWEQTDVWSPWEPSDYFANNTPDDLGLTPRSNIEELAERLCQEAADVGHVLEIDDVEKYLTRLVEDIEDEDENS